MFNLNDEVAVTEGAYSLTGKGSLGVVTRIRRTGEV